MFKLTQCLPSRNHADFPKIPQTGVRNGIFFEPPLANA